MTPEEIQQMMALQMFLSGQPQASGPVSRPESPQVDPSLYGQPLGFSPAPNPLLVGNDALRQQFAADPSLAPANNPGWLDQREAHILGNDSPPPSAPTIAPQGPAGMPADFYKAMLDAGAQPHTEAPQSPVQDLSPIAAPQLPPSPQNAPSGLPRAPDQASSLPDPFNPAPTTLATAFQPGSIGQFAQQAPILSSLSPAPASPAVANINNNVTMPTSTFTAAPKLPELPKVAPNITPNMGAYSPPPSMPGYGMARTGSPFQPAQAAMPANLLPTYSMFAGSGQPTVSPSLYSQEPDSLYARMLGSPRNLFTA